MTGKCSFVKVLYKDQSQNSSLKSRKIFCPVLPDADVKWKSNKPTRLDLKLIGHGPDKCRNVIGIPARYGENLNQWEVSPRV